MSTSPAAVLEQIFTTNNPETGTEPPPEMAWVVFANGTCFFTAPSEELLADATHAEIIAAALAAFDELGPVNAGTPSADFNPVRLDGWFPDEPVWFVAYDHPAIATIVVADGEALPIGLDARARREQDHDARTIVCTRDFHGATTKTAT